MPIVADCQRPSRLLDLKDGQLHMAPGEPATWCSVAPGARGRGADEPYAVATMTREYEGIDLNLGFINLTTAR